MASNILKDEPQDEEYTGVLISP